MKYIKSKIWHICAGVVAEGKHVFVFVYLLCDDDDNTLLRKERNEIIVHFLIIFVAKMSDCYEYECGVLFGVKCI